MRKLTFYAVERAPQVWPPDAVVFVDNGPYSEAYLIDFTGHPRYVGNSTMINQLIGTGASVWFSGAGIPSGATGKNGDFYLKTANGDVYKKVAGTWTVIVNIKGPAGANGVDGATGAQGPQGDPADIVFGETPAGAIDGSNATFTTAFDFVPGKIVVFLNGLLQKIVTHYNTSGTTTILFNDSPHVGDIVEVNYIKP